MRERGPRQASHPQVGRPFIAPSDSLAPTPEYRHRVSRVIACARRTYSSRVVGLVSALSRLGRGPFFGEDGGIERVWLVVVAV